MINKINKSKLIDRSRNFLFFSWKRMKLKDIKDFQFDV